jgi:ABC-type glycerol-3-phosphate transport system substrate-binding protein
MNFQQLRIIRETVRRDFNFTEVANALFTSGKGALTTDGSWMIGTYVKESSFPMGFARLPEGPEGRKSMFNGLADSIFVGTAHPEEAWPWVKFAASQECADIVGSFGVVFPAQQSGVDAALAKYTEKGPGAPGGQSWTPEWLKFDNSYFVDVKEQKDADLLVLPTDACLFDDEGFRPHAERYAADQEAFFKDYVESHLKLSELGAKFA